MTTRILGVLLMLSLVVSVGGCWFLVGAGAATGGVLYVKGAAQKSYPVNVEKAYNAVLAVLAEDKIAPYKKEVAPTVASVEATLADGKEIKWSLKASGADTTEVTLRIGTFGDKDRSNYFFQKLDKQIPG